MKLKYRKIACFNYDFAVRDEREMDVLRDMGLDVAILAETGQYDNEKTTKGIEIKRVALLSFGNKVIGYIVNIPRWVSFVLKEQADILSCHDIKALLIGYISKILTRRKTALVYDAHEFETGRTSQLSDVKLLAFIKIKLERFLIKRCDLTIVVNDSIADEMTKLHCLSVRPTVVRSTPFLWDLDKDAIRRIRKEFESILTMPADGFLLMLHGNITEDGSREALIRLIAKSDCLFAVIMGNGRKDYIDYLQQIAKDLGVSGRTLIREAVPYEDLGTYVAAADVGMVIGKAVSKSYYYMSPNKLFENIQACVPIISNNFPETARIVNGFGIGLTCNPDDLDEIYHCVEKMRTDKEFYRQCKVKLDEARKELCWEKERSVMYEAYERVIWKLNP